MRRAWLLLAFAFAAGPGLAQPAASDAGSVRAQFRLAYGLARAGITTAAADSEALREYLEPDGVQVSLINPGHIETAQVASHVGALPLLMPAETAALRIRRGLERGQEHIDFPRRLAWLIRAGRILPWRWRAVLARSQRFEVDRP